MKDKHGSFKQRVYLSEQFSVLQSFSTKVSIWNFKAPCNHFLQIFYKSQFTLPLIFMLVYFHLILIFFFTQVLFVLFLASTNRFADPHVKLRLFISCGWFLLTKLRLFTKLSFFSTFISMHEQHEIVNVIRKFYSTVLFVSLLYIFLINNIFISQITSPFNGTFQTTNLQMNFQYKRNKFLFYKSKKSYSNVISSSL